MRSRRHAMALLAAIATMAAAPAAAQEPVRVVATFSILADLVRQVGGDRVAVKALVGPNGDAHVYSPTPADAKALAAAQVVVMNGLGFEGWIDRLASSSGTKAAVVVASRGVTPIRIDGQHGGVDPHAFQDIGNVKIYVANIRDALMAADPAGKAAYAANAAAYAATLDALDAEVTAAVAAIPADRRKVITSHDAFGYFAKAYGLAFVAPNGVSTEAEASARDVARIIRQVKTEKIPAIFLENIADKRLSTQIARETGARIGGALYSDALSPPGGPAATYVAMMRHNVRELAAALAPGGG